MIAEPALADGRQHAHGLDDLGIAQVVVGVGGGGHGRLVGLGQRLARAGLGQPGEADQQQRADQGDDPEQRMDQGDDHQIDGRPRCIEEGEQAVAGEELPHLGQVLQRLRRVAAGAAQVALERGGEHALVEHHVEPVADADQHARAHHLQQRHQHEQAEHQQGQHQQGGDIAADQGAVVDLQHVYRRRQHQQVDHPAEGGQGIEGPAQAEQ
ncbi:hypothetical protein D3C78_905910 [compost metagenome]